MTTPLDDLKGREAVTEIAPADPLLQMLSDKLEARGVSGTKSLGLVFRYPDLKVVFVNSVGRSILCPRFEGAAATQDFTLSDIISVDDKSRFESEVNPMLQVVGSWGGRLKARDLWGGDLPTMARIWNVDHGAKGRFLFFQGEPVKEAHFGDMRGWRDRELLLALLAHSRDHIYFKDRESRFLRASNSLIAKFGLKHPHEVIGKTDFHFFGVSHAAAAYEDEQEIIRTAIPILDKEELENWDSGEVTWGATSKLPLYNVDGEIVGTFGVTRDITHRKVAEEARRDLEIRLQLAQRLEAIGSLAAGVAHEINTPTQFVSDNVRFLGDAFSGCIQIIDTCLALVEASKGIGALDGERGRVLETLEEVGFDFLKEEIPLTIEQSVDGLRQIAKIVGSMKEYSYPSSQEMSKVNLNRAIENTLNVTRHEWKGVAEMQLDFDPDLPEVDCRVDEINQVMLNLVVNAAQAIAETESRRGVIGIRTALDGDCVCIDVSDTGVGMSEEVRSRIFEPFFTTKEVGKGTGQGLALVRNVIVKTHRGAIDCTSKVGEGSVFRVIFPIDASSKEQGCN